MIPMLFPLILNKNLNPDTIYKALCYLDPANPVFLSSHLLLFSLPFLFTSHADIPENTTFLPQRYFLCQKFSFPYTCLALYFLQDFTLESTFSVSSSWGTSTFSALRYCTSNPLPCFIIPYSIYQYQM